MKRLCLLLLLIAVATLTGTGGYKTDANQESVSTDNQSPALLADDTHQSKDVESGQFVLYQNDDGGMGCREATPEEAVALSLRNQTVDLHRISRAEPQTLILQDRGLQIVLRATQQLERFPQAKAAFLRAAAIWEGLIQTPITIVIDVDYGPTRFGEPFGPQVLGWTTPQDLTSGVYPSVRSRLIASATNEQERELYNSLPTGTVPTDLGSTANIRIPSANGRALGLLAPVADPNGAERNLGRPPSIGFNSGSGFDFDPSDGIDSNKVDFEAVVVHEIGHALGFISSTEFKQEDNKAPVSLSVWDLFRLRPGTPQEALSTARRILIAGGQQSFCVSGIEVPLSTGASQHGGDGRGCWHWKDDDLTGNDYIGIMDPTLPPGKRQVITAYDLLAINIMGYSLKPEAEAAPELGDISGKIQGDALNITGTGIAIGGAIEARLTLLDESGGAIETYPITTFNPGESPVINFTLQFPAINNWRAAAQARLTLLDRLGKRNATLTAGILKGDSGGPSLSSLSFNGSVLKIKGKRLNEAPISLEVNGEAVPISSLVIETSKKKMQIKATASDLQLSGGPNRVRIISNGLRSNARILNL